jgi:hypothetical protein
MSNYSLERMNRTRGRVAYFTSHRSIQGRYAAQIICEDVDWK